ncbi:MAG: YkvA family protein [Candidatus Alcyoniella australis]|nr:YkvA family protein [Candidatus Alcyoniella australis]
MASSREQFVRNHFKGKVNALLAQAYLPDHVRRLLDYVKTFYQMAFDPAYKLPRATKALIVFVLFYFIMPFDLIPDMVPVSGLLDDFVVSAYLFKKLAEQIERYRAWRRSQGPLIDVED